MKRTPVVLALCGVLFALPACHHSLAVRYPEDHDVQLTYSTPRKVAVMPYDGRSEDEVFFKHAVRGLQAHPSVREIRTNWNPEDPEPGFRPESVVRIRPRAEYTGSGWNFLITFPGFLVFAPAWNGFVYHGHLTTEIERFASDGKTPIESETIQGDYGMRHCDFGRSFWAESGWWTPGYGATSLFSGLYNITYDTDATEPFQKELRTTYGEYIAERIMRPVIAYLEGRRGIDADRLSAETRRAHTARPFQSPKR